MLAHQGDVVEVMVFDDGLIAAGDVLGGTQQPEVAVFQNVLLIGGKIAAFAFAHPGGIKNCGMNAPNNALASSPP